jgi:acetate kinase
VTDVILVLNAGSSSIKFSTFAVEEGGRDLALRHRGGIEGISSDPQVLDEETTEGFHPTQVLAFILIR